MSEETCKGCALLRSEVAKDGMVWEICMRGVFGSKRRTIEIHSARLKVPTVPRPAWCKEKAATGAGTSNDGNDKI